MTDYQDYGFYNDKLSHAHQYLLPAILSLLNKESKILDLGCGNGALSIHLIKLGFDVYGLDASPEGIAIAQKEYPKRFYLQDLSSEKLPSELNHTVFTTIISTEVLEHLYDPQSFIIFCKKVLTKKRNTELIISTPYHGYFKNLVLALFDKSDLHYNPLWRGGHIKFWSKKTLCKLLEKEGFEVVAFKGCGRFPYLWKSMVVKARLK